MTSRIQCRTVAAVGVKMPKVSVVMPVYNGVRFVAKAIDSVLAQDFEDWELIVINDGSTDGTADVLADFTDMRIHVISQANGGEAVARNRGLDEAHGEYVGFLDADDLYLPNALCDMSAFLDAHSEADALFSDGYFCDEGGSTLGSLSDIRPGPYTGNILEPLVLDPTVIAGIICTLSRRKVITDSGVRFDPSLVIGPDWDFWIHLSRAARFGYLNRPTCMYRVHQTNVTRTSGAERRRSDLVRGRMKVLNAPWFGDLSLVTRIRFYYDLLVNLVGDQPDQQQAIMSSPKFTDLPAGSQADLLRLAASHHLGRQEQVEFSLECLRRSLVLQPGSSKGRALLYLGSRSPTFTAAALGSWRRVRHALDVARSVGRRKPRPAPAALSPASE